jgi:hypothetical protein
MCQDLNGVDRCIYTCEEDSDCGALDHFKAVKDQIVCAPAPSGRRLEDGAPDLTILPNCTTNADCGGGGICAPDFNKCAFSCAANATVCGSIPKLTAVKDQVSCADSPFGKVCLPNSPSGPSGGGPSGGGAPKICQPKGLAEYEGPSQCIECATKPANAVVVVPCNTTTNAVFQCAAGFTLDATTNTCTACGSGKYKTTAGNEACSTCATVGAHQVATDVKCTTTTNAVFQCAAGYTLDATTGACTACGSGKYKASAGNGPCAACAAAGTGQVATDVKCTTTTNALFQCGPGYTGDGATCTACESGKYKTDKGSAACSPCATAGAGDIVTSPCTTSANTVINECAVGYGVSSGKCVACTGGNYMDVKNPLTTNVACKACAVTDPLKGEYVKSACTLTANTVVNKCVGVGKVWDIRFKAANNCDCPDGFDEDEKGNCQESEYDPEDFDVISAVSSVMPRLGGALALVMMVIALVM